MLPVSGDPFGVAATPDGRWAFVVTGAGIDVLRMTRSLAPELAATIPVNGYPEGDTVTPDGKYLLVAAGAGAVVISVTRAETDPADAVLGTLDVPIGSKPHPAADSAIEVTVPPGDKFAFVTLEYDDQAAVFDLGKALAHGFGAADYIGSVPLGQAAVGMTVAPDGRWLYATSEGTAGGGPDGGGTLTVISLARADADPAASVAATVPAGCQPVRVITSGDGTQVWVTARGSDALLCFSAAKLAADPAHALVADVRVGEAPVGLMAVRDGSVIVVADSNRFSTANATSNLDAVNVAAALAGRPAVIGRIKAGSFPREMALLPSGTLLVSDFSSGQVESVDVADIPGT